MSAHHAADARGAREPQHQFRTDCRVGIGGGIGQDLERQGLQRVAGQNGSCVIEGFVNRRPPPAQVVVVHGGQIVVDERIAMQQFHRAAGPERAGGVVAQQSRSLHGEEGPEALAAPERRMPQGLHEARRPGDLAGAHFV